MEDYQLSLDEIDENFNFNDNYDEYCSKVLEDDHYLILFLF